MFSNFEKVRQFHEKFQLPVGNGPQEVPAGFQPEDKLIILTELKFIERMIQRRRQDKSALDDIRWGRIQMMLEELREFTQADTLEEQADSLVDLVYFALGTAVMMGLPWDQLFDEVHRANMEKELISSKEESTRLNKLDVKKPEGWQAPDIKGVLEAAKGLTSANLQAAIDKARGGPPPIPFRGYA